MDRIEILKTLNTVFTDALDSDEDVILTEGTTAADVNGWDSLTHIQLVVAIEKKFKIRFTSKEIQTWKNVGELITSIEGKIK
ncbi:MAG: acyl carrier protein [Ferruginibacter sp.]|uniref:acyl carrier protein n=1 Tax=Ferruginibacter sp. TaxID=1940288 RepID=UPI00265A05A9|nr:acyl carrier protein [Ferruginibacter sp.]MDB5280404.1 acyl carrier protein [Ferruginibacter sp.]